MQPGEHIGVYTIVSMIGSGGMSVVYLAEETNTDLRVVVKELRQQYRLDRQLVDRFLRGATALKDLRHPHLGRVLDCMERDGRYFIVEEYLSGGSLADLLGRGESPSVTEALAWCRDALNALNYVNEFGIVHRDLKPSNLMLDGNRQVRLIDFGIARVFGEGRLTRTGDGAIGTPWYMSPEQIRTPGDVDHLTDVYSAGIVLYELLTGSVPFDGNSLFTIQEKITSQPPPPMRTLKPGIDPALEKIVFKAMEKNPKRRYGGCGEFALRIDRYLKQLSAPSRVERMRAAIKQIASSVSFRSAGRLAIVSLFVIAVLVAVFLTLNLRPSNRASVPPEVARIGLLASADPSAAGEVGSVVTFRYQVASGGNVPLKNVRVIDGGATPPVFVGGDANGDGALDGGETWRFESRLTIEQSHLNGGRPLVRKAVASSEQASSDPIEVSVSLERRPGIAIATLVNGAKSVKLTAPGSLDYAYEVSNRGNVGLTGVRVKDHHGATPILRRGDTNGNQVLDVGETWEYLATLNITRADMNGGRPLASHAIAVSDQSAADSNEVSVTFEPKVDNPVVKREVGPVHVGVVPRPRKTKDVLPEYPAEAQTAGVQGEVNLEITIGLDGRVRDAKALGTSATAPSGAVPASIREALERAAIAAARQWEYAPSVLKGTIVPVIMNVNVRFVLKPPATPPPAPPAPATPQPTPSPDPVPVEPPGPLVPVKRPEPVYPPEAIAAGAVGTVTIEAKIDPNGKVQDVRVVRSVPMLDQAALDAVRQWEYAPTGRPAAVTLTINIRFGPP